MEQTALPHPWTLRVERILEWVALVWSLLFTTLAGLFTAGYALDDPGGLTGIGIVLAILLPMLAVAGLALRRPDAAVVVLLAVLAVAVVAGVWQAFDPMGLHEFENANGPVTAIGSFMTLPALALLGARRGRPLAAGLIILGLAGAALFGELLSTPFNLGSSMAVALPMLLAGALLLAAGLIARLR